jgi:hypothetical protein
LSLNGFVCETFSWAFYGVGGFGEGSMVLVSCRFARCRQDLEGLEGSVMTNQCLPPRRSEPHEKHHLALILPHELAQLRHGSQ